MNGDSSLASEVFFREDFEVPLELAFWGLPLGEVAAGVTSLSSKSSSASRLSAVRDLGRLFLAGDSGVADARLEARLRFGGSSEFTNGGLE